MATGTIIFIVALAVILAFGATMIWQTFHDTDRRRGSVGDEEAIKREVYEDRPRADFDADSDVKPEERSDSDLNARRHDTPRHGRHEFR